MGELTALLRLHSCVWGMGREDIGKQERKEGRNGKGKGEKREMVQRKIEEGKDGKRRKAREGMERGKGTWRKGKG